MSRLPRLAHEFAVVERQHAPLLRQIDHLTQRAQNGGLTVDRWQLLADEFGRFVDALRAHRYGEFRRVFRLPVAVNEEKVTAEYKEGILRVAVPKIAEAKPKRVEVKT